MKRLLLPALLIICVAIMPGSSPMLYAAAHQDLATQRLSRQRAKPKLLALLFRADWCPSCKILEPEYNPLEQSLAKEPILFVRFDFTNDKTTAQARALSARLGVEPIFRRFEGSTGFALLVSPSTKRIVGAITIADTPDQMRAMFMKALKQ